MAGYSLLVGIAYLATQILVGAIIFVVRLVNDPDLNVEEWIEHAESDDLLISIPVVTSAFVCIPLLKFLTGRRESDAWAFLRIKPTDMRTIVVWSLGLIAFVVVSDLVTTVIGRPVVPEFMVDAYASSVSPAFLFAALVFAAPAFEELFFRGFILGTLESSGVPVFSAAVVSSIAWAGIHVQYDLYNMAIIFLLGMLLSAARIRTESLIPCLVMHGP